MNKVIEDYVLQQKIGSGQYGNVYKAEHKKKSGLFAVKVMNVDKFKKTPKLTEFTNNQINILAKMSHPNIIRFVQMLRTTNNYYLIYQFCNGGTLAQLLKQKGKLKEQEAIKIFQQLRSAFSALFDANILHRDLKPTNILFNNGEVKLADFGFCKQLLKQNDMTQTMVGSPIYMAPQVLKGLIYDARADIWSLGVILYEMLYGVCPYEESTIPKLISLIDNIIIKFPPQVPVSDNIKNLLKRILTLKYRERISAPQFIKYDLHDLTFKLQKESQAMTALDAAKFIRKALIYLTQTLDIISNMIEEVYSLRLAFFLYKIITTYLTQTVQKGAYWEILHLQLDNPYWDEVLKQQAEIVKPYGVLTRQSLIKEDTSLKTKVELETNYIDSKYFLQSMRWIDDNNLRVRLLNCFLFNKHIWVILQKRPPEWTDPTGDKLTMKQKQDLCNKFARYY